jgi:predicted transcriptional regulator
MPNFIYEWYKAHQPVVNLVMAIVWLVLSIYMLWISIDRVQVKWELDKKTAQLEDLSSRLNEVQPKISQLKADRLELYKALSSCNFLRKMEKFPLNQVEADLFKAVTTYYNSEAEVTKALEKYVNYRRLNPTACTE